MLWGEGWLEAGRQLAENLCVSLTHTPFYAHSRAADPPKPADPERGRSLMKRRPRAGPGVLEGRLTEVPGGLPRGLSALRQWSLLAVTRSQVPRANPAPVHRRQNGLFSKPLRKSRDELNLFPFFYHHQRWRRTNKSHKWIRHRRLPRITEGRC